VIPSRLVLPVLAAAVLGSAAPSQGATPRTTTVTYDGPSRAMAPATYARVFLTDSPGTLTGFVLIAGDHESRLRIRAVDDTGLPVAVTLSWDDREHVFCDASDVRSPAFEGGTELYVEVLAGVCEDGSSAPTASAPTRGSITFDLQ